MKPYAFILAVFLCRNAICQTSASKFSFCHVCDSLFFEMQYKSAIPEYEKFIPTNTVAPITRVRLGFCYQKVKDYKSAHKIYDALLCNPPPPLRPFLYSRLAMIYSIENQKEKALMYLDSAIANYYGNISELENAEEYGNIRSFAHFGSLFKKAYAQTYPCSNNPSARQFDFWLGDWDVFNKSNNVRVGTSKIENVSGGCNILENWTSFPPVFTGKSFNWFDTTAKVWNQLWIGSDGSISRFNNGVYSDGAMRFTFEKRDGNGTIQPGNFIFYNLDPNKVRQYQEISIDGGKNFKVVYDFIYIRNNAKK